MAAGAVSADAVASFGAETVPLELPQPRFMPCPECGGSVAGDRRGDHVCDRERWLDYQMIQQRAELESFETEIDAYLASPRGRFELWYAEYVRRTQS